MDNSILNLRSRNEPEIKRPYARLVLNDTRENETKANLIDTSPSKTPPEVPIKREVQDLPGQGPRPDTSTGSPDQSTYTQPNEGPQEDELLEAAYANELAKAQESDYLAQEVEHLYQEGRDYRRPSLFKYIPLGLMALVGDALIILLTLTGFGLVVTGFVGFAFSSLISIVFWFTDSKQKNAKQFVKGLESRISSIVESAARVERTALRTSKAIGKLPGLSKAGAKFEKWVGKIGTEVRSNPIGKVIGGGVADSVPILNVVPWLFFGVVWAYFDEKKIYKNARESADAAYAQLASYI